mgnify:CR=1 FL=1|tara:strand:- start:315 stop:779 length:465 start_codon:yes stop_codon:yes gene_type:complete
MAKTKATPETENVTTILETDFSGPTGATSTGATKKQLLPTQRSFQTNQIDLSLDNNYIKVQITMSDTNDPLNQRTMLAFYPKKMSSFQMTFKETIDPKSGKTTFGPDSIFLINNQTTSRINIPVELIEASRVSEGGKAKDVLGITTFLTTNTAT